MNLNDTQQRVRSATIIVLAGLALLFLVLDSTGNLNNAFAFLQDPFSGVMGWTAARVDRLSDALAGPRDLQAAQQRIAELEEEVAEQERTIHELRERQQEYQTYVDLFNRASEAPQLQRITARVIGRDPNPLFQSIIIDKGTRDGVAVGMPVESARGLVGQVFQATPAAAHVLLITDNVMSVAGRLSTSRAEGMVFGGGLGARLRMDWIGLEKPVETGDIVLTSGTGGFFPEDLVIGQVTEVSRSDADLFQRAVLEPAVNFNSLEVVFVISGFEPVNTTLFEQPPEDMPLP
jgi:rod shape-determining protein MreC